MRVSGFILYGVGLKSIAHQSGRGHAPLTQSVEVRVSAVAVAVLPSREVCSLSRVSLKRGLYVLYCLGGQEAKEQVGLGVSNMHSPARPRKLDDGVTNFPTVTPVYTSTCTTKERRV